jgi:hypothetical protein
MLLDRNVEVTCATKLFLEFLNGWSSLFQSLVNRVGNYLRPSHIVAFFGLCNVKSIQNCLGLLGIFCLLCESVVEQNVASLHLNILDSIFSDV